VRSLTSLALAPVFLLSFAACGDSDEEGGGGGDAESYADTSVDQIQKDVEAAMNELESVHLSGSIIDEEDGEITMDVTVSRDGDCTGTMALDGKGSFEILAVDGVSYFKADEEFWTSQAGEDAAPMLMGAIGDKWATDSSDPEGFGELCDLDQLLDEMNDDEDDGDAEVKGTGEVDGRETVEVSFTSDDGNPGTMHIAADEPHYVVKFDVPTEGAVTFSEFDEDVEVEKPAEDEVFDLSQLGS
jgi:hypothetical protein